MFKSRKEDPVGLNSNSIVTMPEPNEIKIVHTDPWRGGLAGQIWPVEEQKRQQKEMALRYDELCGLLQEKMQVPKDHNSRGDMIRERMRLKLEASRSAKIIKPNE